HDSGAARPATRCSRVARRARVDSRIHAAHELQRRAWLAARAHPRVGASAATVRLGDYRMPELLHERGHRTGHARLFLVVVFVLQRLADAAVIWFTFLPVCPWSLLRGVSIGSFVWTTALLVGVWRRLRWARYLLTSFNWGYITVFTFCFLQ